MVGDDLEVYLAENYGFCYGVKRAINLATESSCKDSKVCTFGPIIHNPQMVNSLKEKGITPVDDLAEIDNGTIIIRSHGVGPEIYEEITEKNLNLVDATCPHVKKAQKSAEDLSKDGYSVVIVGEANHPEVKSIKAWAGRNCQIVGTVSEAMNLGFVPKMGIVAQTTFSNQNFNEIVSVLLNKSNNIKILRTICDATFKRQSAAKDLAKKVDMMIVIGGKISANTAQLAKLCSEYCKTYHIETVDEIVATWFHNIKKIGITAGASTPDWIIKEVYEKCKRSPWRAY